MQRKGGSSRQRASWGENSSLSRKTPELEAHDKAILEYINKGILEQLVSTVTSDERRIYVLLHSVVIRKNGTM